MATSPAPDLRALAARMSPQELAAFVDRLSPAEVVTLRSMMQEDAEAQLSQGPRRDQVTLKAFRPTAPDQRYQVPEDGDWRGWLFLGGRGTGKTAGVGVRFYDHMMGPPCIPGIPGGHRGVIIGPTLGDVSSSCYAGPSGLRALDHRVREVTRKGGTVVEFPNGAVAHEFGAHSKRDVDRLRSGGNTCVAWCEELAAWQALGFENDAWDLLQSGLRLGPLPQWFASTTPKPTPLIRELYDAATGTDRSVTFTHGTMWDNRENLAESFIEAMESNYAGTRVEAQELLGILLADVEGALWATDQIVEDRVGPDQVPELLVRVAIGVDPAFSEQATADEAGIITVGLATPPGTKQVHAYVLDDSSCRGAFVWPRRAVEQWRTYHGTTRHGATVVAEANLGGKDFITKLVKAEDSAVPVNAVHATEGKRTRAEPVAWLYDKHLVHHVGTHALLEQEMTSWVPGEASPNRLDALVWALEHLRPRLVTTRAQVGRARDLGSMPSRLAR